MLERKYANILVDPVSCNLPDDVLAELFRQHVAKKQLVRELVSQNASHDDVLDAMEMYVGTKNMDNYLITRKEDLNNFFDSLSV